MRFLYSILIWLLVPVALLYFLLRSRLEPAYRRQLAQRFGFVDAGGDRHIWLHAASVGEADAAILLCQALSTRHPKLPLWITVFTPTGAERVRAALGDAVSVSYLPLDTHAAVTRFLKRVRPVVGLIVERELWPNLYRSCAEGGVPLAVVSARWSAASVQRYRRLFGNALLRRCMQQLAGVVAQSEADGACYVEAGLPPEKLAVGGNIKYDYFQPEAERDSASAWRAQWRAESRPVWVAASTHEQEEQIVLRCHRLVLDRVPGALLIVVPRHPQRFDRVAELCAASNLNWLRLSALKSGTTEMTDGLQLLLVDTLGDLKTVYAASDVAFVGGSFVAAGGHNLFEAMACGAAVLTGAQLKNWQLLADEMQESECLQIVNDQEQLVSAVCELLCDSARRQAMVMAGQAMLQRHRGSLDRTLRQLAAVLPQN